MRINKIKETKKTSRQEGLKKEKITKIKMLKSKEDNWFIFDII